MADWWLYPFDQATVNSLGNATIVKTVPTTLSALGSAATAGMGARAFITDATTATFNATAVGGGSLKVLVHSDGTNWLIG
jgi:hypothetical protein